MSKATLGHRLRKYFFPDINDNKGTILFWNVINNLSFDAKIRIYKSIPYFKTLKYDSEIKTSLQFIQSWRNRMAHWELDEVNSDLENIIIHTFANGIKQETIPSS